MPLGGITAISAAGTSPSYDYLLVLTDSGTIAVKDSLYFNVPNVPTSPTNVVAISAGLGHAAAVVNDGTPRVARRLLNQTVYSGSTVMFSSGIVGSRPGTYQWQFNGTDLVNATNNVLVLTNVPLSAAGDYACIVANALGAVTNSGATLTVLRSTPRFGTVSFAPGSGFAGQVEQLSGHGTVLIFASTNLADWFPIFTNPPVTGSLQFRDPGGATEASRFYRAIEE